MKKMLTALLLSGTITTFLFGMGILALTMILGGKYVVAFVSGAVIVTFAIWVLFDIFDR